MSELKKTKKKIEEMLSDDKEQLVYFKAQYHRLTEITNRQEDLLRRCQELLELSERYVPGDLFYRDDLHDELATELEKDTQEA